MCIIAVSKIGVRQPSLKQLHNMYDNNPDGAGYMYARNGKVHIHKGFMTWEEFSRAVENEHFTKEDPVVYHFRISTQAGVCRSMTHPFPLTKDLKLCEKLDLTCPTGIAHNGIITMTSFAKETRFSDTAYFIAWYMSKLVRKPEEITDPFVQDMIDTLTNSKWAMMDGLTGDIVTIGKFTNVKGLLFSNASYSDSYWTSKWKSSLPTKSLYSDDYYLGGYSYTYDDYTDDYVSDYTMDGKSKNKKSTKKSAKKSTDENPPFTM